MWLRQMKTERARRCHALLFTLSDSAVICAEDKNTSDSWPWQFHRVTLTVPLLFLISDCSLLPSLKHPVNKYSQIMVRLTYLGCWYGNFFFFFFKPPLNRWNRNFVSDSGQLECVCRIAVQSWLRRCFVAPVKGRTLHRWSGTRFSVDQLLILNAWRSVICHPGSLTWNTVSIVGSLFRTCQMLLTGSTLCSCFFINQSKSMLGCCPEFVNTLNGHMY